jgi:predicted porin
MGVASVAEAVTATFSGNHRVGVEFDSATGGTDTNAVIEQSSFSVALSEVTDGGTTIASSFMLANEADGLDNDTALTLTFTDGSKLDIFNAGNAAAGHDISVPGTAGEEGVTVTTSNNAPSGLDFMASSTELGVEWHSAADFMADGLKISASVSTDTGATATTTARLDSHWALGATYVTDAGDTALTFGAGISQGDNVKTATALTNSAGGYHVGVSAVTGDLTVAVGFGDGDSVNDKGGTANGNASTQVDGEVVKAGVKYVTGDITLNLGVVAGTAKDSTTIGTAGTTDDSYDKTSASVSYAVASGVTAVLGYSDVDSSNEGTSDSTDGSAWYIGANMSF